MKRKCSLFLCFVFMLLAFLVLKPNVSARGSYIFVSPTGSSSSFCSQADPCNPATALQRANDGDLLIFKGGTYTRSTTGPILKITKAVSLIGGWDGKPIGPFLPDPKLYETIFDGENGRQLIEINTSSPEVIRISGITFKNGETMAGTANRGGAILVKDGGTVIESCRFENNYAYSVGGAICVESNDRFEVKNNLFIENEAKNGGGAIGILREITSPDVAIIERNHFIENSANYASAIEVSRSSVVINANLIANNNASSAILVTSGQKVKITNNIIYWDTRVGDFNSAITDYYEEGETTEVINNTIVNVTMGIRALHDAKMNITNNIIKGCYYGIMLEGDILNLTGTNNLFYENNTDTVKLDNPITGQDPLFVNVDEHDYHIQMESPAVDAGAVVSLTDDFDGDKRPSGKGYDIGADEVRQVNLHFLPLFLK